MSASFFTTMIVRAAPLAALTPVFGVPTYLATQNKKPAQSQPLQEHPADLANPMAAKPPPAAVGVGFVNGVWTDRR